MNCNAASKMLPMKDIFYGRAEPVWILNHNKDDEMHEEENESGSKNAPENKAYSPPTSSHYYPYQPDRSYFAGENDPQNERYPPPTSSHYYHYHPDGHYFTGPSYNSYDEKETEVVMKIPICCGECEDSVKVALYGLDGVKSVKCDIYKERVTVVVTTRAPADVLMECRKLFKKSRMWRDDD